MKVREGSGVNVCALLSKYVTVRICVQDYCCSL